MQNSVPAPGLRALAILPPSSEDLSFLRTVFARMHWHLYTADSIWQARDLIASAQVGVVITDRTLPCGNSWKQMLAELGAFPNTPELVIASRLADDLLWAEVLNLGGYDVLIAPLESSEVCRVLSLAWDSSSTKASRPIEAQPAAGIANLAQRVSEKNEAPRVASASSTARSIPVW